jgi:hypothetical protein
VPADTWTLQDCRSCGIPLPIEQVRSLTRSPITVLSAHLVDASPITTLQRGTGPGQGPALARVGGFQRAKQGSGAALQEVDGAEPARSRDGVSIQTVK